MSRVWETLVFKTSVKICVKYNFTRFEDAIAFFNLLVKPQKCDRLGKDSPEILLIK